MNVAAHVELCVWHGWAVLLMASVCDKEEQTWTLLETKSSVLVALRNKRLLLKRDCCSQKFLHTELRIYPHCRVWPKIKYKILMHSITANLGNCLRKCKTSSVLQVTPESLVIEWYQLREFLVKATVSERVSSTAVSFAGRYQVWEDRFWWEEKRIDSIQEFLWSCEIMHIGIPSYVISPLLW